MSFVVPVKEIPRMDYQLPPPQAPQVGIGVGVGVGVGLGVGVGTHQMPAVVGLTPNLPHLTNGGSTNAQDESGRWTQYQQLWRQHVYMNAYCREETAFRDNWTIKHSSNSKPNHGHGHSGIKELASSVLGVSSGPADDKTKDNDSELWCNVEAQTAFLGPNLWDKTYETDLKYVDLDEFLSENGVSMDGSTLGGLGSVSSHGVGLPKRERSPSPSDCMSPDTLNPPSPADSSRDFDPRTRAFSDEDLKPQPMIKKSRKQFVPDNLKDDKYWARRRKNNMAAKRSRDARRMKENQIALRAGYLEKENVGLRQELERLKKENLLLRDKLSKCGDV